MVVSSPSVIDFDPGGQIPESSSEIRQRVLAARERALYRLRETPWVTNSDVPGTALRELFPLAPALARDLASVLTGGRLSARGMDRVARVAWTVADLADAAAPTADHVQEALALRDSENQWPS